MFGGIREDFGTELNPGVRFEPADALADTNANMPPRYLLALEESGERERADEAVRTKHAVSRGEGDRVRQPSRRGARVLVGRGRWLTLRSHETTVGTRPHRQLRSQQGELRAREILPLALAKRGEFRQSRREAAHAGRAR